MSQKNNHNALKKLARGMMTKEEIKNKCPIFCSKAWRERAAARAKKQANQGKKK